MWLSKVIVELEKYCTPKTNFILERFHFNSCVQQQREGVDAFLTTLKSTAKSVTLGQWRTP